ncbi:L-ribulose-5-phosphate 3-epimerase [Anaerotruncus colihominis]|uniref:L-ribulose-5-phosphate 3-epimerase n=1 Tax=Anaerotruncus colihominis TaxID=169435 RepID=A0A845T8J0_9FIRM|nr:L-ribulose-5-phosphate 3-epimerase [Anaerotruncus colihominis]MCR2026362.1 L-ribulose-5-phosphate 3-epimerase [Anaerotruncus colihominis]NDO40651.1 L-ribulose-5-phosphate 3-epimerase [Anaerotruncus colihominis]
MLGDHLLGLYEKALPASMSWSERLHAVKELGFDYMEISIDETDERLARLFWTQEEKDALHRAMAETGTPIPSMCLSGHRRFPYGSADPSIRQKAYEMMEQAILFAREFGVRVIQLAGYDVYYEPSTPESLQRFKEGLACACALAEKYQVMLSMEIMDTPLISSITRYKAFKADLPTPWFTVYPDLGNLTAWGSDVVSELTLGGKEIAAVHLKDTLAVTPDFPGKFKCVPFGGGCVDFPLCLRQLERQGYHGPYMMEMWHQPDQDWKQDILAAKSYIEQQFALAMEE